VLPGITVVVGQVLRQGTYTRRRSYSAVKGRTMTDSEAVVGIRKFRIAILGKAHSVHGLARALLVVAKTMAAAPSTPPVN
jgi:hypothetical protein